MHLKEFFYHLPEHLIAQTPLSKRDTARLMVVNRTTQKITHDEFCNLGKYLPPRSRLLLNNSKVIPARLLGRKAGTRGKVEIFLLKQLEDGYSFKTLMRPLKKIQVGGEILFNGGRVTAEVIDIKDRIVRFNRKDILKSLDRIGYLPLPPYIKRRPTARDRRFYQTVYARYAGSVAAPTAGLHFTKPLLTRLRKEGHAIENATLHINYATFKSVDAEDIREHKMHTEEYAISQRALKSLQQAKKNGKKIAAVGTTSCRVLETVSQSGILKGRTNLFIYPGYQFRMTDILITNFHLPLSSLLMLVYAFGTISLMKKAYKEAIKKKYRFYSYGDAMVIV